MIQSGQITLALIVGLLLTTVTSWLVAAAYRRQMVTLMRRGPAPDLAARGAAVTAARENARSPAVADRVAYRRASFRLLAALTGISILVGLTQAVLALHFVYEDRAFSVKQTLIVGAVYAWPMVLAWGLMRRWSWGVIATGIFAYMLLIWAWVMLASTQIQSSFQVSAWLAGQAGLPLIVILFISGSGRIRAIAPYLLPPFLVLSAASVIGLGMLFAGVTSQPGWLAPLVSGLGTYGTLAVFVLLPWVVLAWPVYALVRRLVEAYRAKRFSDLGYLFATYWFAALFLNALTGLEGTGPGALIQLLAWGWIPLGWIWLRRWLQPRVPPPTLLVLRVFQRDAQVERLFDKVIERWRQTGNTVLIAGTDVVSRTLEPDELFAYLNGRLAERFVSNEAEVSERLAALDLAPDPDGRYRVNECYCFDTTWQTMLAGLVRKSDLALMDLRGFKATNAGCIHELKALARAPDLQRVIVLYDRHTERPVAEAATSGAPSGRFHWLDAGRTGRNVAGQVLDALFAVPRAGTPA